MSASTGIEGLVDHQVVQRGTDGTASVTLTGAADGPRRVAVVDGSGRPAVDWHDVASAPGPWKVDLALPTGGPFDVVGEAGDGTTAALICDVLVGDLWVLAGQSNMQGIGRLSDGVEDPSPLVHVLDLARTWRLAVEPLHRVYDSPDLAHHLFADPAERAQASAADLRSDLGAGLGVAFARELLDTTGVPVGLIATAQGGTSLGQWSPARRDQGGASLFASMLTSIDAAGGRVAGVLWYQGESDALGLAHREFAANLRGLVDAVRDELASPDLPFFHVQLGRVFPTALPPEALLDGYEDAWNAVREAQRTVDLGAGGMTTAVDLATSDFIHVSTRSLRRLGRRLAKLASGRASTIHLDAVDVVVPPVEPPRYEVRVRYRGATGRLSPVEHVAGFSIRDAAGVLVPLLYEAEVASDEPSTVVLRVLGRPEPGHALWYGFGTDPYCNLVDEADLAAPAFGPWPLA